MMKVVVITQSGYLYIPYFFQVFLEEISEKEDISISSIFLTPSFDEGLWGQIKRGLRFYGLIGFIRQGFKMYLNKILSHLAGRKKSVKALGDNYSVPVRGANDVNSENFVDDLEELDPDLVLSVSAPQVFKKDLLQVPNWGCVNIHSAKLPKYRGMMPNFWAMYHGDDTAGITVHTMDEELDKGKIILQDEVKIKENDTLDSLIKRSKSRGAELVVEALEQIRKGEVELKDYQGEGSYFSFPTREDVKEFKRRGNELL